MILKDNWCVASEVVLKIVGEVMSWQPRPRLFPFSLDYVVSCVVGSHICTDRLPDNEHTLFSLCFQILLVIVNLMIFVRLFWQTPHIRQVLSFSL